MNKNEVTVALVKVPKTKIKRNGEKCKGMKRKKRGWIILQDSIQQISFILKFS